MKKVLTTLIIALFVFPTTVTAAPVAARDLNLIVNGTKIEAREMQPVVDTGAIMLPLTEIYNMLSNQASKYDFNEQEKSVTIQINNITLKCWANKTVVQLNNDFVLISDGLTPLMHNGTIYMPLRFTAECFNMYVAWDSGSKTAIVRKKEGLSELKRILETANKKNNDANSVALRMITQQIMEFNDKDYPDQSLVVEVAAEYDLKKKYIHFINTSMQSGFVSKTETYDNGKEAYVNYSDFDLGWIKTKPAFEDELASLVLPTITSPQMTENDFAALTLSKDLDGNYFIKGYIFAGKDQSKLVFDENTSSMLATWPKFYAIEYSINKDTLALLGVHLELNLSMVIPIDEKKSIMVNSQVKSTINNLVYNPKINTTIPDDIVKSAISIDSYK